MASVMASQKTTRTVIAPPMAPHIAVWLSPATAMIASNTGRPNVASPPTNMAADTVLDSSPKRAYGFIKVPL